MDSNETLNLIREILNVYRKELSWRVWNKAASDTINKILIVLERYDRENRKDE